MKSIDNQARAWADKVFSRGRTGGKQQTAANIAKHGGRLCVQCQKLGFSGLFRSGYRTPETDGDCFSEINSLENVSDQRSCPLGRICCRVISSSYFDTRGKNSRHYNDPKAIYMEARRADHAPCGSEIQGREADDVVASCLHVETGEQILHDEIVCLEAWVKSSRTLHNLPVLYPEFSYG
jgi:hypothetical protein